MHPDLLGDPARSRVIDRHVGPEICDPVLEGMVAHGGSRLGRQSTAMETMVDDVAQIIAFTAHQFQQQQSGIAYHFAGCLEHQNPTTVTGLFHQFLLARDPLGRNLTGQGLRPVFHGDGIGNDRGEDVEVVVAKRSDQKVCGFENHNATGDQPFSFMAKTSISITMES